MLFGVCTYDLYRKERDEMHLTVRLIAYLLNDYYPNKVLV